MNPISIFNEQLHKSGKQGLSFTRRVKDGITIHEIRNFSTSYLPTLFNVDVYLPPEYDASGSGKFPVLFFNDGQDMARMKLTGTLHRLFLREKIASLIVVAIHAGNRMQEYGTAGVPDYKQRGSQAANYSQFVIKDLLPFIREQYRVGKDPGLAAFAGFSLGGLSALDIVWNHPGRFGKAGVFSGALWWRHSDYSETDPDANRIMHEKVQKEGHRPGLKFWFEAGTLDELEDRNRNGIIDAIDDTLDLIAALKAAGYTEHDTHYREVEGGIHHPSTWGQVLPEFLQWAFPPEIQNPGNL